MERPEPRDGFDRFAEELNDHFDDLRFDQAEPLENDFEDFQDDYDRPEADLR